MRLARSYFTFLTVFLMLLGVGLTSAWAQNIVSGEIDGIVTDPSGAVLPNAQVTMKSVATGETQTTTTAASGTYRFPLLRPGNYQVSVVATGFNPTTRTVVVALGQVTSAPVQVAVSGSTQTVEVTAETPLLHTEDSNLSQTYDTKQVELLPNPGGDLTNYALTTPGVVVSTGMGYGNFTSNGIGGMSNLYTINGNDYNDPYLNLNNSGASNMLLGANEVQEVSVVTNGYTAEYGRVAGSQLNYTTKSGSNQFHGNAAWLWNGSVLNANDWFNNNTTPITPRPHAVSNQWAGSIGGPIKKDKIFFYYDNEGIRYVLPSGGPVFIPSPQFESATLANVPASEVPFYTQAFKVYNGASGFSRATPVTTADDPALGCGDLAGTGTFGTTTPCALKFQDSVNNLNTERLMSGRVDVNLTAKDQLNFRYKQDRGVQATSTDPINSAFSANSVQPEDDGQFNWTRTLNNHMVNQFIASGLYYSAIFGPPNFAAATAVFPVPIAFTDGLFSGLGNFGNFPQGRNVAQYQFVDDFSWTKGSHGIKFGTNFRRNDIGDFSGSPTLTGSISEGSMTSFFNGLVNGGSFTQHFSTSAEFPVAYYSVGLYAQDEWQVKRNLKVTLGLRVDRNSDMVCQKNCFARPATGFLDMNHSVSTPYNQTIHNVTQAFPGLEAAAWGPRAGFAWSPFGSNKTVVRGGAGIFSDLYPALLGSRILTNLPNVTSFTITSGPISSAAAGNVFAQAAADNAALQSAYANGGTLASIQAALKAQGSNFTPPNLVMFGNNINNPKYVKWNLEIEREIDNRTSITANYVGNRGYDLFQTFTGLNAYCDPAHCPNGFQGLPTSAPDPRFSNVTQYENGGRAAYDGLQLSATRRLTAGFTGSINYMFSHTLDDLYEGGIEPLFANSSPSLRTVINPANPGEYNYGPADQDIRHVISANYLWDLPFKSGNGILNNVLGGWQWSGVILHNTGTPFSVYYTSLTSGSVLQNAVNDRVLGFMPTLATADCTSPTTQCLTQSQFIDTIAPVLVNGVPTGPKTAHQTTWGSNARNFFRGPGYFDADMSLMKNIRVTEGGLTFTLGASAYNIFNHPNFDRPISSLSNGSFGQIISTVGAPNSPYGNFQGSAVSGRVVQLDLKVKF